MHTILVLLSLCASICVCSQSPLIYDYIIVGGGAGASVVADELVRFPNLKILVLDAGITDCPACDASLGAISQPSSLWQESLLPQPQQFAALLRQPTFSQWLGAGGNTRIWGAVHARASKTFLDTNFPVGYQYNDLLPQYKRNEDHFCKYLPESITNISAANCSLYHGSGGPIPVAPQAFPVLSPIIMALAQYGRTNTTIGFSSDPNNPGLRKGLAFEQASRYMSQKNNILSPRTRADAYHALLKPALNHPGITLITNAKVTKVIVESGGNAGPKAIGVNYFINGTFHSAFASKRIFMCAGVLYTPQILHLSGIGPADYLGILGVQKVWVNNSAIGQGLQTHQAVITVYEAKGPVPHNSTFSSFNAMDWWFNTGLSPGFEADVEVEILESFPVTSVESAADSLLPEAILSLLGETGPLNYLSMEIENVLPTTTGYVRARSLDPFTAPEFDYGWDFANIIGSGDLAKMLAAIAYVRQVMAGNNAFANTWIKKEFFPGEYFRNIVRNKLNITTEPDLTIQADTMFIQYYMTDFFHLTSSCALGQATDLNGAVKGIRSLSIVDNSVLPHNPDANPTITLLAVARVIMQRTLVMDGLLQ
jgi:choline dehydrogenase